MDQRVVRLGEAAHSGNMDNLYALLREDPYLLENIEAVPFIDTPLHEAVISGKTRFVMEMMNLKPSFARKLNLDGFSPLHLAIGTSQPRMVVELLKVDPSLALVKGREGMTPLHLAVRNGASDLVVELIMACPECNQDVNVDGQTALHIAVTIGKIEVLEVLIGWLCRWEHKTAASTETEVLNKRDHQGNTTLHVAAYQNKDQELRMLLSVKKIDRNIKNHNGLTVLDVLQSRGHQMDADTERLVLQSGAKQANSLPKVTTLLEVLRLPPTRFWNNIIAIERYRSRITDETRNALLVLSTLVITTTYQLVLQPPGGTNDGKVVMNTSTYSSLWMFNTAGFLAAVFLVMFMVQVDAIRLLFIFPVFPCMYAAYMMSSHAISPSDASFEGTLPAFCGIVILVSAVIFLNEGMQYLWPRTGPPTCELTLDGFTKLHRVTKVVQK
ncbi:Ankyrin repeat-containing protein BDA1 [Cardamine amara subsp. amara]|uniref:Ankyrin repeat-containing protein BDA1 n=1 Tax=Cardamine amara subsp. amara TaxID=228776 RepID=A0ABD1ASH0_CARAN